MSTVFFRSRSAFKTTQAALHLFKTKIKATNIWQIREREMLLS
jgi:hypothetical protein